MLGGWIPIMKIFEQYRKKYMNIISVQTAIIPFILVTPVVYIALGIFLTLDAIS